MRDPRSESNPNVVSGDTRSHLIAGAVLLLVAIVLVLPALRPGSILAPVDLMYETPAYAPVRPPAYDEPANPHLFDQAYQFVPWRYYAWQRLRDGELPLWNPQSAAGTPFVATMQSALFYPVNLLSLPLPFAWTFVASAILRLWIAGYGAYALMRCYKASLQAGILSGICFMLSGFVVSWLGHPHANVAVWFPLLILGIEELLHARSGRAAMRWWSILALVTGIQFLGGHIETSRDVLLAGGIYAIGRLVQQSGVDLGIRVRRLALTGFAVVTGAGIAAIQLVPFLEWLPLSAEYQRRSGYDLALWNFDVKPLLALPLAVMPNLYNNPTWDGQYWSFNPWSSFNESVLYAGTIPLALAIASLACWKKDPLVRTWAIVGGMALGLAFRLPVLDWFNQLPANALAHPGRLRLIAVFAAAALAGLGLDALRDGISSGRSRRWLKYAIVGLLAIPAMLAIVFNIVLSRFDDWETRLVSRGVEHFSTSPAPPQSVQVCRDRIESCGQELAHAFTFTNWEMYLTVPVAALSLGMLFTARKRPDARRLLAGGLIALTGAELLVLGWGYNPAVDSNVINVEPPIIRAASPVTGDGRIAVLHQDTLPDSQMLHNLRDVRGLDFKTAWYATYLDASGNRIPWIEHGVLLDDAGPLIATLDVRAIITSNPHIVERRTSDGSMHVVATEGDLVVLEPLRSTPGTVMRFSVEVAESDEVAAGWLSEFPERILFQAILIDDPGSRSAQQQIGASDPGATVTQVRGDPEHRSWQVTTAATGLLVVSDSYYPGWRATVDGQEVEVHRANMNFRAVVVPAGDHLVDMRYEPASIRYGGLVTLIALVATLAVLGLSFLPSAWLR
ncbi:hypothetical protein BH23CHL2_BH23CHL2_04190 [soil metagenome]